MTIKTKYNIGDIVHVMHNEKPILSTVYSLRAFVNKLNPLNVRYTLSYNGSYLQNAKGEVIEFQDSQLFKTKQALLKSL